MVRRQLPSVVCRKHRLSKVHAARSFGAHKHRPGCSTSPRFRDLNFAGRPRGPIRWKRLLRHGVSLAETSVLEDGQTYQTYVLNDPKRRTAPSPSSPMCTSTNEDLEQRPRLCSELKCDNQWIFPYLFSRPVQPYKPRTQVVLLLEELFHASPVHVCPRRSTNKLHVRPRDAQRCISVHSLAIASHMERQ